MPGRHKLWSTWAVFFTVESQANKIIRETICSRVCICWFWCTIYILFSALHTCAFKKNRIISSQWRKPAPRAGEEATTHETYSRKRKIFKVKPIELTILLSSLRLDSTLECSMLYFLQSPTRIRLLSIQNGNFSHSQITCNSDYLQSWLWPRKSHHFG